MDTGSCFAAALVEFEWLTSKDTSLKRHNEGFLLCRTARHRADGQTKLFVTVEDILLNAVAGIIIQISIGDCGSVNTHRDQSASATASPGI